MKETEFLRFLGRRVRIRKDISHQEHTVLGINWALKAILIASDEAAQYVLPQDLDIIPQEDDDEVT